MNDAHATSVSHTVKLPNRPTLHVEVRGQGPALLCYPGFACSRPGWAAGAETGGAASSPAAGAISHVTATASSFPQATSTRWMPFRVSRRWA